jgi:hypothetical protein
MTKTLNVYINKSPKNKTTPNNAKIVIRRGIEIFLNANVGNLLINKNEIKTKVDGTTIS